MIFTHGFSGGNFKVVTTFNVVIFSAAVKFGLGVVSTFNVVRFSAAC